MRFIGVVFVLFGVLLLFTVIGAGFGLILIILGFLFIALGGGRRTVIRNVVSVTNVAPTPNGDDGRSPRRALSLAPATDRQRREPPLIAGEARRIDLFEPTYDDGDDPTEFTDLKNEISVAAKAALAKLHASGFQIKAKPDRIVVSRNDQSEILKSNAAIIDFVRSVGLI